MILQALHTSFLAFFRSSLASATLAAYGVSYSIPSPHTVLVRLYQKAQFKPDFSYLSADVKSKRNSIISVDILFLADVGTKWQKVRAAF